MIATILIFALASIWLAALFEVAYRIVETIGLLGFLAWRVAGYLIFGARR